MTANVADALGFAAFVAILGIGLVWMLRRTIGLSHEMAVIPGVVISVLIALLLFRAV